MDDDDSDDPTEDALGALMLQGMWGTLRWSHHRRAPARKKRRGQ